MAGPRNNLWTQKRIDKVFPEIFERISEGEPLAAILRSDKNKFPSNMTFYAIMEEREDLSNRLERAYRAFKDARIAQALDIAFTTEEGKVTKDTPKGLEVTTGDMTHHRQLKVNTIFKVLAQVSPNVGRQNALGDRGGQRYDEEYED